MILEKSSGAPLPRDLLPALAERDRPFLLESAAGPGPFGRFSFAGADPVGVIETRPGDPDPLDALRALLRERAEPGRDLPTPLPAGAVGFLSYDLGRRIERIPEIATDDLGMPEVSLGVYDAVVTWDHATGETWLSTTGGAGRIDALRSLLRAAAPAGSRPPPRPTSPLRSTFSRDAYLAAVARAKAWIEAGDIFQVNLSQRFATETENPPAAVYARLLGANPAPFAAWLEGPWGAVLSASPERFLRVSGDAVETVPIKGTCPRGREPSEDRALARALLESEKDRAELVMIVDLLRSDLGKVARFGSVEVAELPALTSHPTVHHLHGRVTARLAGGRDVTDLLRAAFPGGSITGAPKVRAMEIIEETEPVRRGVYTGAIGYFSVTGEADLSVAIRTLQQKDGRVSFSVGGGIVADSDPELEYRETLDKGRGLAAALGFSL